MAPEHAPQILVGGVTGGVGSVAMRLLGASRLHESNRYCADTRSAKTGYVTWRHGNISI